MLFVLSKEIRAAKRHEGEERLCQSHRLGVRPPLIIPHSYPTTNIFERYRYLLYGIHITMTDKMPILLHYVIIGYIQRLLEQYVLFTELGCIPPHLRPCRYAGLLQECNHPDSGNGKILSH